MSKQAIPLNSLTDVTNGGHIIYFFEDFNCCRILHHDGDRSRSSYITY